MRLPSQAKKYHDNQWDEDEQDRCSRQRGPGYLTVYLTGDTL